MDLHFATAWKLVADAYPDSEPIVMGGQLRTYREYDEQGARVGAALLAAGIGPGTRCRHGRFKVRAVPVNVSYRYLPRARRVVVRPHR